MTMAILIVIVYCGIIGMWNNAHARLMHHNQKGGPTATAPRDQTGQILFSAVLLVFAA
jgi:hypothetical protein